MSHSSLDKSTMLPQLCSMLALATAAVSAPTEGPATQGADAITLAPAQPWSAGTRFGIEIEKLSEIVDEGGRKSSRGSVSRLDVDVLAQAADGLTYRWTWGATRPTGAVKQADALTQRVLGVTQGLRYDVRARADGAPIAFVDADAVHKSFDELVASLRKDVEASGENASDLGAALDAAVQALQGPAFETALLRDPARFFAPNGLKLEAGKPSESESTLPNPLDGAALPCKSRWTLVAHDAATHTAKLEWLESVDPAVATRLTREAIKQKMSTEKRRQLDDEGDERLPSFTQFEERAKLQFDTQRGLTTTAEFVRTVELSGKKHVETRRFRLAPESRPK